MSRQRVPRRARLDVPDRGAAETPKRDGPPIWAHRCRDRAGRALDRPCHGSSRLDVDYRPNGDTMPLREERDRVPRRRQPHVSDHAGERA